MDFLYNKIILFFLLLIYYNNLYCYSFNKSSTHSSNNETVLTPSIDTKLPETHGKFSDALTSYLYNGSNVDRNQNNSPKDSEDNNLKENLSSHHVKVLTIDENDSSKLNENDSSKYSVEEHPLSFSFKFNSGARCVEVKYDNKVLWNHTKEFGEEFPNELFFHRTEKKVTLNFYNFNLVYQYSNGQWTFHSRTNLNQISPKSLKIITSEDSTGKNLKTNDDRQYYLTGDAYVYYYKFLEGARCVGLDYEGNSVWKYDPNEQSQKFPRSVCFLLDLKLIFIEFEHSLQMYRCNGSRCLLVSDANLDEFSPSNLKIEVEDNSGRKAVENEPADFDVNHLGFLVEYVFKDDAKCVELKYKDQRVWKHNTNGLEDKENKANRGNNSSKLNENENERDKQGFRAEYPKKLYFNVFTRMLVMDFNGFYLVYQYEDGKWDLLSRSHLDGFSEYHFKFLVMEPSGVEVLDGSKYDIVANPYNDSYMYLFKNNAKMSEMKYKGSSLWKYDKNKYGDEYPRSLYINYDTKMLIVESATYFTEYMYVDGWKMVFEDVSKELASEGRVESRDGGQEQPKIGGEGGEEERRVTLGERGAAGREEPQGSAEQVQEMEEVRGDQPKESRESKDKKESNDGNVVNKVENYFHKFSHLMDVKKGGNSKLNDKLVQIITADDLNGTDARVNDPSKYSMESVEPNKVHYKFKEKARCTEVRYKDQQVWRYNREDYGDNYPTELQVDLDEGFVTVFSGTEWHCDYKLVDEKFVLEYYSKKLSRSEYPPEVKILTELSSERPHSNDKKDSDGYTVNRYYRKDKPLQIAYVFDDGVKCREVRYRNQVIWKHQQQKPYPVNVTYVKDNNAFLLVYHDKCVTYKQSGGQWVVDKEEFSEDSKELRPKTQYVLDDALVLVLMLSALATVIVLLILLLTAGFMHLLNKRTKLKMQLQQGNTEFVS